MKPENNRVEKLLWRRFESEHRRLDHVLDDVESLIAAGSFQTARKRFGEHRLLAERHRFAEDELLTAILGDRESRRFVQRVRNERKKVVEQTQRIWGRLCRDRLDQIPSMVARLRKLAAQHEEAERRLILAELPLGPTRRRAHKELLLHLS